MKEPRRNPEKKDIKHKQRPTKKLGKNKMLEVTYENCIKIVKNQLNILQNDIVFDGKFDQIMDNQYALDRKIDYMLRNDMDDVEEWVKQRSMLEIPPFNEKDLGDVLGKLDYQAKVTREAASALARLEESNAPGNEGQEETVERPINSHAKRENGSSEDPAES